MTVCSARHSLLVVDDNPGYLRLVRLALDDDPAFEVVAEASSADEAVTAAAQVRPDVALVDVLLPSGEGFRLPADLRKVAPGCVVVFTSAHPRCDFDAIGGLGGLAVLPKSLTPSRLGRELAVLVTDLDEAHEAHRRAATTLAASRDSPSTARRFVKGILETWECAEVLDTVTLLASELVSNDDDLTGRGTDLVEMLATAWGISGRPDGKSVWFEIALPLDRAAPLDPGRAP